MSEREIKEKIDELNEQIGLFDHVLEENFLFGIDFIGLMLYERSLLFAMLEDLTE